MDKPLLFYDCGELGWSIILAAHVNFLVSRDNKKNVTVCTYRHRFVLYNGLENVKLIEIPPKILENISHLDHDGTHMYDHINKERITHNKLWSYFNDNFGSGYIVSKDYGISLYDKLLFYRFNSSESAKATVMNLFKEKLILVFPRCRSGKFGNRNLTESFYIKLCERLCDDYPYHVIVSIGSKSSAYLLEDKIENDNFVDLVGWNDNETLDLFIAMCNYCQVEFAVGSQSALPKISLICKIPTFIIGHEKKRHLVDDNWMNTRAEFYRVDRHNGKYMLEVEDQDGCINKIIEFGKVEKPMIFGGNFSGDYGEDSIYHPVSKFLYDLPLLFFDCAELGWSQHLVAFIKFLRIEDCWRKTIVVTDKSKFVLYKDCCDELAEFPDSIRELFDGYSSEQYFLVNPDNKKDKISTNKLVSLFRSKFKHCEVFSNFVRFTQFVNENHANYYRPYISSNFARNVVKELTFGKKAILLFTRNRKGYHETRNINAEFYKKIIQKIRKFDKELLIILLGSKEEAFSLESKNVIDLVSYDDNQTLDLLIALCNLHIAQATFGPQSGPSKIALLCGIPSFIVGHERERHMFRENWAKTYVSFFEANKTENGYEFDHEECFSKFDSFLVKVIEGGVKWI
uniref:Glycosyltransferase n=1 Tax=viral metagenome TaxID=1070528 RepID=A0A6M3L457_9ZZZZ